MKYLYPVLLFCALTAAYSDYENCSNGDGSVTSACIYCCYQKWSEAYLDCDDNTQKIETYKQCHKKSFDSLDKCQKCCNDKQEKCEKKYL
ncbi:hypothetical protein K502DRAFT_323973 [Neoconidiobolus thromboides FSU 785]|nr:hypothetical protein K502DRAFT_323973 [Neoconidiobolus thromboides FSU 785]